MAKYIFPFAIFQIKDNADWAKMITEVKQNSGATYMRSCNCLGLSKPHTSLNTVNVKSVMKLDSLTLLSDR